jgi:4-hydroxythreonine-4-phosphate dehydrogenase
MLATEGLVEGIVTGPISKNSLQLGGYPFTGHTELLSRHFGAPDCQMMMVYRAFRVVPLTRHLPVHDVSGALSVKKIVTALRVVNESLVREFGVPKPRLAVSGLNPHAGDGGVLGSEEIGIIAPALRRARRLGLRVTGPVPADALFQDAKSGTFDVFITMYHDQGLIPFKMISKRRGVNVTVGLPVVRTSVDHGVAYDIAGKGIASTESLKEAYRLAETLVRRRRKRMG